MQISFGSDNHSGVHPRILKAVAEANAHYVPAYGDDPYTQQCQAVFKEIFGPQTESFFVFNGTAANVLCLKALTRSWNAVICAQTAHIATDECGAPELNTACKLLTCPTPDGKLTPAAIACHLHGYGDQHHVQPRVISISQATEMGTLYTPDEISDLARFAHQNGMYLHLDGSRLANAAAALGCSMADISSKCGVDALSLGGTKNGLLLAETVLFFKPELAADFIFLRKQEMQLFSKSRFIAAQYLAYFRDGLWREMAAHANESAKYMAAQIEKLPKVSLTQKVESNALFAILPREVTERLLEKYCFYIWNEASGEVRWMCAWNTTVKAIDTFVKDLKSLL